jgi:hypothetical protein
MDMMPLSGCYLNKLMIANNYLCFYHQMSRLNSPKHYLICNSKLGILLEMLIYTNVLSFPLSKSGGLFLGRDVVLLLS